VSSREPPRAAGLQQRSVSRAIVSIVIAIAAGTVVWALPGAVRFALHAPSGFWAMTIAAMLVDIPLFGSGRRGDLRVRSSLSVCFTFAIFVLYGAQPAIVVQALAGAVTVIGQRYRPRAGLYFISRLVLATLVAEVIVHFFAPRPITTVGAGLNGGDLAAFVVLGLVWIAVNYGLLILARTTVSPSGVRQATAEIRYDLFGTAAAVLVVSPLLTTIRFWWKVIIVAPLMIWNQLAREQLHHEEHLSREPASGLLNRQGLAVGLREITALDAVERSGPRPFGVIVVTADALITINRTLGRELYEQVVNHASRRLTEIFGDDRVGRVSGEGMVVLVPDLTDEDAAARAGVAAQALQTPVEVDDIPFTLDPIAGVALSPKHGRDLSTLLMKAELAVSEARRQGLHAMLYVRQAADVTRRRIDLLRELRTALDDPVRREEITVLYQPQVQTSSGQLTGVEALVRWTHPEWGLIPTEELIEAIEASDVMHLLTRRVVELVTGQLRVWNEHGEQLRAAVNVSVQDLHEPGFIGEIDAAIREHQIAPEQLTIEITERMLLADAPLVAQVCKTLVRIGVGLSLDDFGTGHASLQQLRQLPLSEVKVDQSYVRGIVDNPADRAIVTSVHQLARTLGVEVVAEGVEDQRTADCLATLEGTIGQGYHFGKPMSAADLDQWRASR
jgi:diguanylate cyclase (GGDEF)-like protein